MAAAQSNPLERQPVTGKELKSPNESSHHPDQQEPQPPTHRLYTISIRGEPLVCLQIGGQERLCLAQISSTLLHSYSYNEIHNRRVALGITCVQCSPTQLDALREAGAMPNCSRRCGTITRREAERLVKSFLEEPEGPRLPDNFAFNVVHHCGWGCEGSFLPAKYNSSRAKCIRCCLCQVYFSPNKFIFHSHRKTSSSEIEANPTKAYRHPDAANFNAWRRHLFLRDANSPTELLYAWEDVKAMFNGGNRKRWPENSQTLGPQKKIDNGERGNDLNACFLKDMSDFTETTLTRSPNRRGRKDSKCSPGGSHKANWRPCQSYSEPSAEFHTDHVVAEANSWTWNRQKHSPLVGSITVPLGSNYSTDFNSCPTSNLPKSNWDYPNLLAAANNEGQAISTTPSALVQARHPMSPPDMNSVMLKPYHALLPPESLIKNSVAYSWSLWLAYRFLNPWSNLSSPEQTLSMGTSNTHTSGFSRPFRMPLLNTNKSS